MAHSNAHQSGPELDSRTPSPVRRIDAYLALGTAAFAGLLYVLALSLHLLPPNGLAVAFFAAAPLCASFALATIALRALAAHDAVLGWVAAGLAVGLVAMVLQLVSFPLVMPGGGLLGTSDESSAALYLLFHLSLPLGAAAGILGAPGRLALPAAAVGVILALLFAVDTFTIPDMLRPDGTFTPALIATEYVVAAVVAVAATLWVVRVGRSPEGLRGWVGVALLLSFYDVLLNAVGGARFEPVWWSSLSLRVASYAVLAAGALWTVLAQLRDLESYSDSELVRREGQLRRSLRLTHQLLSCAQELGRAVTPAEVGRVLAEDAISGSGVPRAAVLVTGQGGRLRLLGESGDGTFRGRADGSQWHEPEPGLAVVAGGRPVFLGSREDVTARFPRLDGDLGQEPAALAALPIHLRDEPMGVLLLWGPEPHDWSRAQQDLLAGIAAQGGQAIARALAYEAQASAARTLQESLLPSRLPHRPDLALAARYVPGESGLRVGGDWYDCVEVGDRLVALVVGDVMGKGLRAAALMGQMRTTLRSVTAVDPSPSVVLQALDRVTLDLDADEIATMAYVLLDVVTGRARVARAGHLPPLLVGSDGAVTALEGGGSPPLGAPVDTRDEAVVDVPVGSLFVLYTDGVVESRQHGLDTLADFVASVGELSRRHGGQPEPIADALLEARVGKESDDISLLLARFTGASAPADGQAATGSQPAAGSASTGRLDLEPDAG